MMKRVNIKNIVILLVILVLVHFAVGLFISPKLGEFVIGKINQYSKVKVSLERVHVWPLTLSLSLQNLTIFDSQNTSNKIADIKQASVFVSPLGLLSRRLVVSEIKITGAAISLEGEPDGSFNIQKLTQPTITGKPMVSTEVAQSALKNKDWFMRGYDLLKKKFSSDALKKEKVRQAESKKVVKTVAALPKGRRVHFKLAESYLLEIKKLLVVDSRIDFRHEDGRSVQVENARIELDHVAFDPELGSRLGKAEVEGQMKNAGVAAGTLKFLYQSSFSQSVNRAHFYFMLKEVNLDAVRFIYEKSLPVEIGKGILDLTSDTTLINDAINSSNQLTLSNYELKPKASIESSDTFMPLPLLCEVLNNINPLSLDFTISGTVDKPQLEGFTRSLEKLVKPNMKNIGQLLQSETVQKGIANLLGAISGKKEDK